MMSRHLLKSSDGAAFDAWVKDHDDWRRATDIHATYLIRDAIWQATRTLGPPRSRNSRVQRYDNIRAYACDRVATDLAFCAALIAVAATGDYDAVAAFLITQAVTGGEMAVEQNEVPKVQAGGDLGPRDP